MKISVDGTPERTLEAAALLRENGFRVKVLCDHCGGAGKVSYPSFYPEVKWTCVYCADTGEFPLVLTW